MGYKKWKKKDFYIQKAKSYPSFKLSFTTYSMKKKKSFYEEQKSYIPLMALTTHPEKNETNHNNNHNYNYQIMITYVFIPRAMG